MHNASESVAHIIKYVFENNKRNSAKQQQYVHLDEAAAYFRLIKALITFIRMPNEWRSNSLTYTLSIRKRTSSAVTHEIQSYSVRRFRIYL